MCTYTVAVIPTVLDTSMVPSRLLWRGHKAQKNAATVTMPAIPHEAASRKARA